MIIKDDICILFDKSIARIESDGSIEFAPNYIDGGWRKPFKSETFKIGSKSKEEAISIMAELERLIMEKTKS